MYFSSFPHFIYGYHGCDRKVGEAVLAGKKALFPSANSYDWLGSGVYFWENSPERALEWAKECFHHPNLSRGRIKEPFVIGAVIEPCLCLDLTDMGKMKVLRMAYDFVKESLAREGKTLPQNTKKKRELDCLVINAITIMNSLRKHDDFDAVRGAFIEGKSIYPKAKIYNRTHIQICVRNLNCIRFFFLPTEIDLFSADKSAIGKNRMRILSQF